MLALLVLSLLIVSPALSVGERGYDAHKKTWAHPPSSFSPFLTSFYDALKSEKIFDHLFNLQFKPKEVGPEFYRNIRLFMMDLGIKNPVTLPKKVAAAAVRAFPNSTPLKFFEAFAVSKETTFRRYGFLTKHNQTRLGKAFAETLKRAVHKVGGSGPKAGLKALAVGSADFFKVLGKFTPAQVRDHIKVFIEQVNRIH